MKRILHIETATDICSVCIAESGKVTGFRETSEGRSHASILTVFIEELLHERSLEITDLDAIAVSMGPGSYTGLRIGVTVAKGLCYGASLPLIALPTLESMFRGFRQKCTNENRITDDDAFFIPMIDARRMEVYMTIFDSQGNTIKETSATIVNQNSFSEYLANRIVYFFGTGADKLTETIVHENAKFKTDFSVSSKYMVELAFEKFGRKNFVDTAYFEPYYLKDFITTVPKKNILSGATK